MPGLDSVPDGADIFIDANIFVFAASGRSPQCLAFLNRCAREEITGVTNLSTLADATHRLMLTDAVQSGVVKRENVKELKGVLLSNPLLARRLTWYWPKASVFYRANLLVVSEAEAHHLKAESIRKTYGLLTNDSILCSVSQDYGISALASHDADFDVVSGFIRYKPTDI